MHFVALQQKTSAVTTCSNNQCAVKDSIVLDEFACSPPKTRLKKYNEEAIIMDEKLRQ